MSAFSSVDEAERTVLNLFDLRPVAVVTLLRKLGQEKTLGAFFQGVCEPQGTVATSNRFAPAALRLKVDADRGRERRDSGESPDIALVLVRLSCFHLSMLLRLSFATRARFIRNRWLSASKQNSLFEVGTRAPGAVLPVDREEHLM